MRVVVDGRPKISWVVVGGNHDLLQSAFGTARESAESLAEPVPLESTADDPTNRHWSEEDSALPDNFGSRELFRHKLQSHADQASLRSCKGERHCRRNMRRAAKRERYRSHAERSALAISASEIEHEETLARQ